MTYPASLTTSNFFSQYILETGSVDLSPKDRCIALTASIALAILTVGLAHLFAYLCLYNPIRHSSVVQPPSNSLMPTPGASGATGAGPTSAATGSVQKTIHAYACQIKELIGTSHVVTVAPAVNVRTFKRRVAAAIGQDEGFINILYKGLLLSGKRTSQYDNAPVKMFFQDSASPTIHVTLRFGG